MQSRHNQRLQCLIKMQLLSMLRFPVAVDAVGKLLSRKFVLIVNDDGLECLPELDTAVLTFAVGG